MAEELIINEITPETCFVPATAKGKGRRTAVAPGQTAARYLHYGRITISAGDAARIFNNNEAEAGLVCLYRGARGPIGGGAFKRSRYEWLYVPREPRSAV